MMDRIRQLTALGIFGLLFCALLFGLGPSLSARLVLLGEKVWEGYAQDLRYDLALPECDLQELENKLASCPATNGPTNAEANDEEDPFADDEEDPFADDEEDPSADDEKDPFADDEEDPFAI